MTKKVGEQRVPRSLQMYQRAGELIAGTTHLWGRRAELHAYGMSPIYSNRQRAGRFWDIDGNEYVDFNMGSGALFLGHAYPPVVKAVQDQAAQGTGITLNHPLEIETAELLAEIVPCAEMVRFCKGGGEADMVAIRIARAATSRDKVLFCGYHGWHDWYIAANLSDASALDKNLMPNIDPIGVPRGLSGTAIPFVYNDLKSLRRTLEANRGEVAAIILEAARNYLPREGFLKGVRRLATEHGAVLIFDEVVTGFRAARGGAQELYGVKPDVATFAKAISNGFALGAIAGKREIMEAASDSFISSLYWAEATGLAAGRATLKEYLRCDVAGSVRSFGTEFRSRVESLAKQERVEAHIEGFASLPLLVFTEPDAEQRNQIVTLYMQETARNGLYGGPGHAFCYEHSESDAKQALEAIGAAFSVISKAIREGDILKFLECPVKQSSFRRLV